MATSTYFKVKKDKVSPPIFTGESLSRIEIYSSIQLEINRIWEILENTDYLPEQTGNRKSKANANLLLQHLHL